ncbi:hypothetical protein [Parasphingorhabdus sp.]
MIMVFSDHAVRAELIEAQLVIERGPSTGSGRTVKTDTEAAANGGIV